MFCKEPLFFLAWLLLSSALLHSLLKAKPKGYPTRHCNGERLGTLTLLTLQEDVPQHVLLVHRPTAVAHVGHRLPHQPDAHNIPFINTQVTTHLPDAHNVQFINSLITTHLPDAHHVQFLNSQNTTHQPDTQCTVHQHTDHNTPA